MKQSRPKLGSLYVRGRTQWIKYRHNGRVYRESSHSQNRADAERLLKRRLGEIATGRFVGLSPERIRVSQLIDMVVEDYRQNNKRSTKEVLYRAERHLKPAFGNVRASDFGSRHIQSYIADRRRTGASDATINRELSVVRRGFSLALRADPPLVVRAPHIAKLPEQNVRDGVIEQARFSWWAITWACA